MYWRGFRVPAAFLLTETRCTRDGRIVTYQAVLEDAMPLDSLHHLGHLHLRVPLGELLVIDVRKLVVMD